MLLYKLLFVIVFVILFCKPIRADISLSEIYPAPVSGEYEWIELVNKGTSPEDMSDYEITDLTGKKLQIHTVPLLPGEYTIATSSSVLNNGNETIYLKHINGTVIETVSYSETLSSTDSYVKCSDKWSVTNIISKQSSNDLACKTPTPTTLMPTALPTITDSPTVLPQGITISEVNFYPETADHEWVELYNSSDSTIKLTDWYLDDALESGGSPYQFSAEIPPKGYSTVELQTSLFNNDGDIVRLLSPGKVEYTKISYAESKKGYSIGFYNQRLCLMTPTKNSPNTQCYEHTISASEQTKTMATQKSPSPSLTISYKSKESSSTFSGYKHTPSIHTETGSEYFFDIQPMRQFSPSHYIGHVLSLSAIIISICTQCLVILKRFYRQPSFFSNLIEIAFSKFSSVY